MQAVCIEMEKHEGEIMKVMYIGPSFFAGLTNGKIYECLGIDHGNLRIFDDTYDDYLYSPINPGPCDNPDIRGKWKIIEDDEKGSLKKIIR